MVNGSGCGSVGDPSYVPAAVTPLNQADLTNVPYCIGTCLPDYGSRAVDCASAERGLEFFPVDVLNGNGTDTAPGTVDGFYAYSDGTSEFLAAGPSRYAAGGDNYSPDSVRTTRCAPDDLVHHIRGGLFREWGGGIGRRLVSFLPTLPNGCRVGPSQPGDPEFCPDADARIESVADAPDNNALRGEFYGMVADLRGWEGISFWARGGPNNSGGLRVYVGDRQLDEDIAFLEYEAGLTPMCQRARECSCHNHQPCTLGDGDLGANNFSYCYDPNEIASITAVRNEYLAKGQASLFESRFPLCGATACDDMNDAWQRVDPEFATAAAIPAGSAECLPYKLTNDLEERFCYDQNNPATFPPDGPDRCGDGFEKGVTLTGDWKLYTVPFTELRQEGYAKEFPTLDLSKISLVRFTWTQGWLDAWLDDVRFYRHASVELQSE